MQYCLVTLCCNTLIMSHKLADASTATPTPTMHEEHRTNTHDNKQHSTLRLLLDVNKITGETCSRGLTESALNCGSTGHPSMLVTGCLDQRYTETTSGSIQLAACNHVPGGTWPTIHTST
jgi:hypothetical protein